MSRERDEVAKMFALALGAGFLGATVAILFAPQAGKRTRRDLRRFGGNLAEGAEDLYEDLTQRLEELVRALEAAGSRGLEQGKQATEKVQTDLVSRLEASKDLISQQIKRVESLRKAS